MGRNKLVVINMLLLVLVFTLASTLDTGGQVVGLGKHSSLAVTVSVFLVAFVAAGTLVVRSRGLARIAGIVLVALYVALLVPGLPLW